MNEQQNDEYELDASEYARSFKLPPQPTYHIGLPGLIFSALAEGGTPSQVYSEFGISSHVHAQWLAEYPEYARAWELGLHASKAYLEQHARARLGQRFYQQANWKTLFDEVQRAVGMQADSHENRAVIELVVIDPVADDLTRASAPSDDGEDE